MKTTLYQFFHEDRPTGQAGTKARSFTKTCKTGNYGSVFFVILTAVRQAFVAFFEFSQWTHFL